MWERWTSVVNEKRVPYGVTLGNHDSEADLTRRQVVELDMTNPYSLSQVCDESIPGGSKY